MNSHPNFYSSSISNEPVPPSYGYPHLSEEQIDDQLIGDLAAGPAGHLASCSVCADRIAVATDLMDSFESVTMAWSERRSATLPIPDLTGQKPLWQYHMAWVTACFAVVIGIGLANANRQIGIRTAELQSAPAETTQLAPAQSSPSAPVLAETASVTVSPREAKIFADNQLLKAVDDELDADADSPAALGIGPASAPVGRPPATISVRD